MQNRFCFLWELCYFSALHATCFGLCSSSKGCKSKGSASDYLQRTVEIANIYISYAMHETENYFVQFVAGHICLFIPGPLAKCIEVLSAPTVLGATWQF